MDIFDKVKKLSHKQSKEIAAFCGGAALLLMFAAFIGGGFGNTSSLLSAHIAPSSQTASILPCSWFGNCPYSVPYTQALTANAGGEVPGTTYTTNYTVAAPGQPVTLYWVEYGIKHSLFCGNGTYPCTITANAPNSFNCQIGGDESGSWYISGDCSSPLNGLSGSYVVSPTVTTTYYLCSQTLESLGVGCAASTITVPTPTTFNSLTASPSSLANSNSGTTIGYSFTPGNGFYGCDLTGGPWGGGAYWLPAGASYGTGPLTAANNTINVACYDNNSYGWTAWHSITVPIAASLPPVSAGATSNSPVTVGQSATISFHADSATSPTQCQINNSNDTVALDNVAGCPSSANDTYTTPVFTSAGTYAYKFYYYQSGWTLVQTVTVVVNAVPVDKCTDISGTQTSVPTGCTGPTPSPSGSCIPTNGSYNGLSCSCPIGYTLSGSTCVPPTDRCNNLPGVQSTVPTNCSVNSDGVSCSANPGYEIVGAACLPQGSINQFVASPSRVLKGNQSTITWSTSHMASCALSAFDSSATSNLNSALSSTLSTTVNSKTIYTLACIDQGGLSYSSSVTVNLIPQTIEQ